MHVLMLYFLIATCLYVLPSTLNVGIFKSNGRLFWSDLQIYLIPVVILPS